MKVYQAPGKVDWASVLNLSKKSIFLAGGISGCRDWQSDMIEELHKLDADGLVNLSNLIIFNPRRDDFCSFFFPASESVQPITLYELGKHLHQHESIVGIQNGYLRAEDVKIQLALDSYHCVIYDSYKEAIREHARALAITYRNVRR